MISTGEREGTYSDEQRSLEKPVGNLSRLNHILVIQERWELGDTLPIKACERTILQFFNRSDNGISLWPTSEINEGTNSAGSASKAWRWSMGQRRRAVTLFAKPRVAFVCFTLAAIEFQMLFSPSSFVGPERCFWGINSRMAGFRSLVSSPREELIPACTYIGDMVLSNIGKLDVGGLDSQT